MQDTLKLRAALERASLRPSTQSELHLLVDVTALGAAVDAARPALSVVFVLDASGSMRGEPLEQVIRSVELLVELLAPEDKVGVVSFSDDATVVCPLALLSVDTKRLVKRRTGGVRALSGTNIEAGLVCAKNLLGARTAHDRQVIVLLSDGAPNVGTASVDGLAKIVEPMRADSSIVTLGYGAAHNSDVLHGIANAGGGQYWFIPDPGEASLEFARALGAQGDVVSDGLEMVFAPSDGVEVLEVLGQKPKFTKEGGVASLPDLREKQTRLVVARLGVTTAREAGKMDVVDITLRYRAAGSADTRVLREHVSIAVADREPELVVEAHQAAMMARAERVRVDARQAADRASFDQAAAMLRTMIGVLEKVPGYQPADGSALSECVEQLVDEATEYEQRPNAERYAAFKATQLGVEVSQGAKHAAAWGIQSEKSSRIMAGITGPALPGCIVLRDKDGNEMSRVPLLSEMTVGRSPSNEICVPSSMLSRRHSRFVCRDGGVVIVDLASTNGTFLNGKRVSSPEKLKSGDKLQIGDVSFELLLDEKP